MSNVKPLRSSLLADNEHRIHIDYRFFRFDVERYLASQLIDTIAVKNEEEASCDGHDGLRLRRIDQREHSKDNDSVNEV